jgi:hypothetical protein
MKTFYQLPSETKERIFRQVGTERGLPTFAVEKDWWVLQTLRIIFNLEFADHTVFKGGTSLSKAWHLIDRFSEDIDIALDKALLGIGQVSTKKQVKVLRNQSKRFIRNRFYPLLHKGFADAGLGDVEIILPEGKENDPLSIELYYPGIAQYSEYINPRLVIEIGSRSLKEPFAERTVSSFLKEEFPDADFADAPVPLAAVLPERTFLEKIFLLHEEFQKDEIRANRLSRHLYDLERMMDTEYGKNALADIGLYQTIVSHRQLLFSISSVDYNLHQPQSISIIPPDQTINEWEKDYKDLSESMIYGQKLSWEKLMGRIKALNSRINHLNYKIKID